MIIPKEGTMVLAIVVWKQIAYLHSYGFVSRCRLFKSVRKCDPSVNIDRFKDRAHLSTFKFFIFEKFSCFIVLVVILVIVQSSELVSVWFCGKWHFFKNIFAIYVGGASLGLPTSCRLIAVSGARLPSGDGLVVRCIKMHHHVKSAITICLQFISNMFTKYKCIPTHRGSAPVFMPTKSSVTRDLCKLDYL